MNIEQVRQDFDDCVSISRDTWREVLLAYPDFDFRAHLARQAEFSGRVFGPGARTKGVIDHIRKELVEIESAPEDVSEWIDVVILALDGAWRAGFSPDEIIAAPQDKAIEHDRSGEASK